MSTFGYDGLGNRTSQTVDGVTTEYVLDVAGGPSASLRTGLPEVIVATTSGASIYYVQIQGQVLAQSEDDVWAYILPDHLGSVRQLVGSDYHFLHTETDAAPPNPVLPRRHFIRQPTQGAIASKPVQPGRQRLPERTPNKYFGYLPVSWYTLGSTSIGPNR